jgi:hypothetical protein
MWVLSYAVSAVEAGRTKRMRETLKTILNL